MKPVELTEGIYWVGAIDWDIEEFHGYLTQQGTTYNAYLILDEEITLIDTVKREFVGQMMARISDVVEPEKIVHIVCNHVEMDHSGGLPHLIEELSGADVVTSKAGERGLREHYHEDWDLRIVESGDKLELGRRTLQFLEVPMVHWPDSMVSYCPEESLLFSNDAFGQHIASPERFADLLPRDLLFQEARKYYANIVLPYGRQVERALEAVGELDVETIAPSHGVIWRKDLSDIIDEYRKWAANETEEKAVVVFDSMWGSTAKMADCITEAFLCEGIPVKTLNLKKHHISDIMTDLITAKYICVGSPTLNGNMLPTVASFLTYIKGLAPENRIGLAFGSYGWSGESVQKVAEGLDDCGFEVVAEERVRYVPEDEELTDLQDRMQKEIAGLEGKTRGKKSEKAGRYICSICNYTYDPGEGDLKTDISAGRLFESLPADWECPLCGAEKDVFIAADSDD